MRKLLVAFAIFLAVASSAAAEQVQFSPAVTLGPNTFNAIQVVDLGTGALPAALTGGVLTLSNVDGTGPRLLLESFGAASVIAGRRCNTSRASCSAISSGNNLLSVGGMGYGTSTGTTIRAGFTATANENWSGTNQGADYVVQCTLITTVVTGECFRVAATGLTFTGTIPVVTGTGTPTIASGSTDTAGEVTSGTSATSVIITFAQTKTNAPFCVVTPQTQLAAFAYTISTSAITITQTATTGEKIDYHCFQH